MDYIIDSCCVGLFRFDHMEYLRYDPGYLDIKEILSFPSEKVFRNFLFLFERNESIEKTKAELAKESSETSNEPLKTPKNIQELININNHLIKLKSQWTGPCYVTLDFDDTVITLHGNQKDGEVGYNPRYHGRPSFNLKSASRGKQKWAYAVKS
ncbi:MAG: hypothetical protein QME49_10145, partial [bacterium]|nr:hypothetical protein [bacterium]